MKIAVDNTSFLNQGHLHLSREEFDEAINDFTQALILNPEDAQTYNNRGVAYEKCKSYKLAVADYDRALELDPTLLFPRINRGNAFRLLCDYARSIAAYDDALVVAPNDGSIYSRRAFAHFDQEDYLAAVRDFEKAQRLGYVTVASAICRGHAYHVLRQPEEAVVALSEAINLDPSNAFAHGLRGWNLAKIGRPAEARASIMECLRLEPNNTQGLFSLGVILQAEGDLEKSLQIFQKAASLGDPKASEAIAFITESLQTKSSNAVKIEIDEADPTSSEQPFIECLNTFAQHEYAKSADCALQLLSKRMFQWLMQVLLISLERDGQFDALEKISPVALESFEGHPWAMALIRFNLGQTTLDKIRLLADDDKKKCQLQYYEAASLLTRGERKVALASFESCASLPVQCPEQFLATSEIKSPEPPVITLERLAIRAVRFGKLKRFNECFRSTELALAIARDEVEPVATRTRRYLDHLYVVLGELDNSARTNDLLGRIKEFLHSLSFPPSYNRQVNAEISASIPTLASAPLTRFSGTLKQINSERLTLAQRAAIMFGFPMFLGRPPAFEYPEHPISKELRNAGVEGSKGSPYARRRFSGDGSQEFPRSRYYSVCSDESGNDNRTLLLELNAYAVPQLTGYCVARSTSTPRTIELVFRGLPGESNPLAQALADPDRFDNYLKDLPNQASTLREALRSSELPRIVNDKTEFVIPIDCSLGHCEIQYCLDLRQSEARQWVIQFFRNPPEGLIGEVFALLAYEHNLNLDEITSWVDLSHIMNARSFGGTAITDMFGNYLRNNGCEALIYPSARSDYMAYFEDGSLKNFFGWNLVDYRGPTASGQVGIDFGNLIEPLKGNNALHEVSDGRNAGSIAFYGNTLFGRVGAETAYRERVIFESSEWRMKNQKSEMFVRGYFWYRKRYTLKDNASVLICDRCEALFSDEDSEILPVCPKCEYPGDV